MRRFILCTATTLAAAWPTLWVAYQWLSITALPVPEPASCARSSLRVC